MGCHYYDYSNELNEIFRLIPENWVCDGKIDCHNGIDENGCPTENKSIRKKVFWENNFPREMFYGSENIISEETQTIESTFLSMLRIENINIAEDEIFSCSKNGRNISTFWRCDGFIDCPNGSDRDLKNNRFSGGRN